MSLVALLALFSGCTVGPAVRPASDAAVEPVGPPAVSTPEASAVGEQPPVSRPADRSRNAAAVSLQATAEQQRASGDLERAAATVERALRIDSRDPRLWLTLAEIRLEQGDADQAAGLARRAETLPPAGSPEAARARALAARAAGN
ncbi:MAG: hypothetical protein AMJ59_20410 [Gammaproteobacteria bacterium SG8_31]|nr:MAG: hypothetical protein AMJ59_20410 [Gammaproteobacteria bacterium SG8_31]